MHARFLKPYNPGNVLGQQRRAAGRRTECARVNYRVKRVLELFTVFARIYYPRGSKCKRSIRLMRYYVVISRVSRWYDSRALNAEDHRAITFHLLDSTIYTFLWFPIIFLRGEIFSIVRSWCIKRTTEQFSNTWLKYRLTLNYILNRCWQK